ncbi:hypothetical protein KC345_g294 [Hortaea werneckii]|nr:hypothetical protein KC345_g294 [Hortaea werneckii]
MFGTLGSRLQSWGKHKDFTTLLLWLLWQPRESGSCQLPWLSAGCYGQGRGRSLDLKSGTAAAGNEGSRLTDERSKGGPDGFHLIGTVEFSLFLPASATSITKPSRTLAGRLITAKAGWARH